MESDIPAAASGLINNFSNDELKELLNDDEKFEELLKDVQQVKRKINLLTFEVFVKKPFSFDIL